MAFAPSSLILANNFLPLNEALRYSMDYSFSIDTFNEYWKSTKNVVERYLSDDLNEELAIICANKLWHLCDWYYKENENSLNLNQLSDFQGLCGNENTNLRILRDICNGSKHGTIEKTRNPMIRKASKRAGAFSSAFSRGFDVSVLEVELTDGEVFYFDDIVKDVYQFWLDKIEP